ncbi:hypothetical protein RJ639_018793 [Escallonia herrerae]|uniref:Amine oxidase domain-containing protein n=1 Tax=Escallonia herrerae TaxID=1293975 RepID=A0AA88V6Y4_9ASTE|nr:hypothetical protein RJ639_018793 [Escallonia herrerae]
MVVKKPRVVIIGAGMAGLTAANKLYSSAGSRDSFELCVVEGGKRIGGRINTSEFGGDRIELGATWIHGIGGSPIHKIAQEINSLQSDQPWECMDGFLDDPLTIAENGYELNPSLVDSISALFKKLMDFAQGKVKLECLSNQEIEYFQHCTSTGGLEGLSLGSFLREGLDAYWESMKEKEEEKWGGKGKSWSRKLLEEAIFAMHENTQRTYTSAGDLLSLDYNAESEYVMFPGEEITIAKGYLSIIESLASVLPAGSIQLGRKVSTIEWQPEMENGHAHGHGTARPVKLSFCDGSTMFADHVIVTVSLGVLKAGIREDSSMLFNPPLPSCKNEAISRLGFGVVNKLFMQLSPSATHDQAMENVKKLPFLQMVFHQKDSKFKHPEIPWWMRRTASLCPIYGKSSVLLSWFAGEEALELESLEDEEILDGVSKTISSFVSNPRWQLETSDSHGLCNGNGNGDAVAACSYERELKFSKILKSQWGNDPLFLGSYSYVAVGSSGKDIDTLAEPLPKNSSSLQILFAGEATHRTHYSTTHGAYFSGLREANRLLQHYECTGV